MKKIFVNMMFITCICLLFSSCDSSFDNYIEVSTIEDIYAMQSNKSYKLTCDLDLLENEWFPLEVKNFDGNGYTIKNGFINTISTNSAGYTGFFSHVDKIENCVFENITMNIIKSQSGSIGTIIGSADYINNIKLFNSSSTIILSTNGYCNIGILGGEAVVNDSIVENCSLKISNLSFCNLKLGGLIGSQNYSASTFLENNKVVSSNITLETTSNLNLSCGGLVANGRKELKNNCTKGNHIKINYNCDSVSYTSTNIGGLIDALESDSNISECISMSNHIEINSNASCSIGGLVGDCEGKINNCLSDSNTLISNNSSSGKDVKLGGISGTSKSTISYSISQNNKITGFHNSQNKNAFSSGFIANVQASIVNSAVCNNTISDTNSDVFSNSNNLLHSVFIIDRGQTFPNINELPILQLDEIIEKLSLKKDTWYINENGELFLNIEENI